MPQPELVQLELGAAGARKSHKLYNSLPGHCCCCVVVLSVLRICCQIAFVGASFVMASMDSLAPNETICCPALPSPALSFLGQTLRTDFLPFPLHLLLLLHSAEHVQELLLLLSPCNVAGVEPFIN